MTRGMRSGAVLLAVSLTVACGGGTSAVPEQKAAAVATPWGEPDLTGVWRVTTRLGATPTQDTLNLKQLEVLYRPEARAKMKTLSAQNDPMSRCVPPPFPYAAVWGAPIQIVQNPGFAVVLSEAYPTFRIVPTNGRPHSDAKYLYPVYMGDSTGRWEGDTLVVDVISFNGEGWLASSRDKPTAESAGAWPTSTDLHVVERWRRVDSNTLEYQAKVEDASLLTGPWETPKITLARQPVKKIQENLCLLGNEEKYATQWMP